MKIRKITLVVEEYPDPDGLQEQDRTLLEEAVVASRSAYAPYSSFRVGAAIRLADGQILTGNNQENAAYPSGLCAERVVMFYAQARFPEAAVKAIAIYASPAEFTMKNPVTPCGACRQVMAEHEHLHHHRIRVIMGNGKGMVRVVEGAENLLPIMFYLEELKRH